MYPGAWTLCWERRLEVRAWDCFCFGTAIRASVSRAPEPDRWRGRLDVLVEAKLG